MNERYMDYGHKVRFIKDKSNMIEVKPVYIDQNFNGVEVDDAMLGSTLNEVEVYLNNEVKGFYGVASKTSKFLTGVWEGTGCEVANVYTGENTSMKVVFAEEAYEDADYIYDAQGMDRFCYEIREYLEGWTINNYKETNVTKTIENLYYKRNQGSF